MATYVIRTTCTTGPRGGKFRECWVVVAKDEAEARASARAMSNAPDRCEVTECTVVDGIKRVSAS